MSETLAEKLSAWRREGAPGLIRPGRKDRRPVTNQLNGRVNGQETHHWDGRVDATVRPDSVTLKPRA
jgi:hypothetical protein